MAFVHRPNLEIAPNVKPPSCEDAVLECFPDICLDYLKSQIALHEGDSQRIIYHLLDEQDGDRPYPKRQRGLKRKRPEPEPEDEEEDLRRKFALRDPRRADKSRDYVRVYTRAAKALLKSTFPLAYAEDVENVFKQNDYQLYSTYVILDKACANPSNGPLTRFKRPISARYDPVQAMRGSAFEAERDALAEFDAVHAHSQRTRAATAARELEEQQRILENLRKDQEEKLNWDMAKAEGTLDDCGCCFHEFPRNRMIHCAADAHWFCRKCSRVMAENAIGSSKYELKCMSIDDCDSVLAPYQKTLFLDAKTIAALDDLEQETVLRMAGIENLVTCPFCPYAAEYPPVETNKEFRCENYTCGVVSCRLCREETHIPKSCAEAARERGYSARHKIEEAMSAALIRKCNKCTTPFIKENGCNKMTCVRPGCRNVQCYVCSVSVEQRHEDEVNAALQEARKQVAEENPDVSADLLDIAFSERVKQDDERRKAASNPPQQPNRLPPELPVGYHQLAQALHLVRRVPQPALAQQPNGQVPQQPAQAPRPANGQGPHLARAAPGDTNPGPPNNQQFQFIHEQGRPAQQRAKPVEPALGEPAAQAACPRDIILERDPILERTRALVAAQEAGLRALNARHPHAQIPQLPQPITPENRTATVGAAGNVLDQAAELLRLSKDAATPATTRDTILAAREAILATQGDRHSSKELIRGLNSPNAVGDFREIFGHATRLRALTRTPVTEKARATLLAAHDALLTTRAGSYLAAKKRQPHAPEQPAAAATMGNSGGVQQQAAVPVRADNATIDPRRLGHRPGSPWNPLQFEQPWNGGNAAGGAAARGGATPAGAAATVAAAISAAATATGATTVADLANSLLASTRLPEMQYMPRLRAVVRSQARTRARAQAPAQAPVLAQAHAEARPQAIAEVQARAQANLVPKEMEGDLMRVGWLGLVGRGLFPWKGYFCRGGKKEIVAN
ncbi:hypothetical protein N0V88_006974 [Collariella sp. IMI 366227]|nr:hypothetical protein N0V88_006974 [Collariella sp. IMI 366227]